MIAKKMVYMKFFIENEPNGVLESETGFFENE